MNQTRPLFFETSPWKTTAVEAPSSASSSEQLRRNHASLEQEVGTPGEILHHLLVRIYAESVIDNRAEVSRGDRPLGGMLRLAIGLTDDLPVTIAPAGE